MISIEKNTTIGLLLSFFLNQIKRKRKIFQLAEKSARVNFLLVLISLLVFANKSSTAQENLFPLLDGVWSGKGILLGDSASFEMRIDLEGQKIEL